MPGVYIFENEKKNPLYVGKSIHLRTRLRQHFKAYQEGVAKAEKYVTKSKYISFYEVESDLEAGLLEARLIKLYQPKYNIISKDDKSRIYIAITDDEFPEVKVVRKTDLRQGEKVYGPFTTAKQTKEVLKVARRIFHFCGNPPNKGKAPRACFYYHIDLCDGACVGEISAAEYRRKMGYLKKFLSGRIRGLIKSLEVRLRKMAREQKYEKAAEIKNQLAALETMMAMREMSVFLEAPAEVDRKIKDLEYMLSEIGIRAIPMRIEAYDMATMGQTKTVGAMIVFTLGVADKAEYRLFRVRDESGGDVHTMAEVIKRRFRHHEWKKPDLVVLDGGKGQLSVAGEMVPADVPVIALAKKEETIVIKKRGKFEEYNWDKMRPGLVLLRQARDEVHRFVNSYHRRVRSREMLSS